MQLECIEPHAKTHVRSGTAGTGPARRSRNDVHPPRNWTCKPTALPPSTCLGPRASTCHYHLFLRDRTPLVMRIRAPPHRHSICKRVPVRSRSMSSPLSTPNVLPQTRSLSNAPPPRRIRRRLQIRGGSCVDHAAEPSSRGSSSDSHHAFFSAPLVPASATRWKMEIGRGHGNKASELFTSIN